MNRRGFTLLEMLVAVAITLLLAGLLLSATINLLHVWRRAQGDSAITTEAMLVLDQIEQDINAAIVPRRSGVWFDIRVISDGALGDHGWETTAAGVSKPHEESHRLLPLPVDPQAPPIFNEARFGRSGVWLRLLTSARESDVGAVPMAVGYQLSRRNFGTATMPSRRYALFRSAMDMKKTFDDVLPAGFTDELSHPGPGDLLASNVVDFGVWLSNRDVSGTEVPVFPNASPTNGLSTRVTRGVVWVMVRILTNEGASIVEALEDGRVTVPPDRRPGELWWEQVEKHSRVFVRRVEMKCATD